MDAGWDLSRRGLSRDPGGRGVVRVIVLILALRGVLGLF